MPVHDQPSDNEKEGDFEAAAIDEGKQAGNDRPRKLISIGQARVAQDTKECRRDGGAENDRRTEPHAQQQQAYLSDE